MISNRDIVENIIFKIKDAKDVDALLEIHQQILHNKRSLSPFHLEKCKRFINKLYLPVLLLNKDTQDKFNGDPSNIIRFKILLSDLYDHSQSKIYNIVSRDENGE